MRLYRWSFRIRFGYLMMTKLRWFCVYFYHTQNTLVILQSLSLYAMRSPLRPSIHPSSFLLFWSRTPHPVLFFLGFRLFYNPLHISARASAHTHRGVGLQLCPVVWPAAAAASSKRIHTFCLACVTSYKREEREKRKI